MNSLFS